MRSVEHVTMGSGARGFLKLRQRNTLPPPI